MTKGVVVTIHVDDYDDDIRTDSGQATFNDLVVHREVELVGLVDWREVGASIQMLLAILGNDQSIEKIERDIKDYDAQEGDEE